MRGLGQITDVLSQALFPIASEAESGLDPRTVKAMQRQGLMQLGLGMMAARNQGAGLGQGLNFAFNQAQQDINQGLGQAMLARRANREDERLAMYDRRLQNADLQANQDSLQRDIDRKREENRYREGLSRDDAAASENKRRYEESRTLELKRLAMSGGQGPVNSQLVTRPAGNGMVRDFAFNPRSNSMAPVGEPYKPVTTFTGNPTEGERKNSFLAMRLEDSLKKLNEIDALNPGASKPGIFEKGFEAIGSEIGANLARDPARQQANAAQLDALDAALTLATGASYTKEQINNLRTSYFPQILDDPATVKAKNDKFNVIVEGAKKAAGRAYIGGAAGKAPPQAIEYLRQNPQFAEQFQQKYGYLPEGFGGG